MFRDDDEVVYCEYGSWTYVHIDDTIELFDGNYVYEESRYIQQFENDNGYFLTDVHDYIYIEEDGLYYHEDDDQRPSLLRASIEEQIPEVETIEEEDDAS